MPLAKHTYSKMNQDLAKNKYPNDIYYEGRNIRLVTNDSFGAITNEKGNELVLELPEITSNPTTKQHLDLLPYPVTNLKIIGHTVIDEKLILLVQGDNDTFAIYKVDKEYNINLIFFDVLEVSYPLDVKSFYENENIQKIYIADGVHELRYFNIAADILNLDKNFISSVPDVQLTTPKIIGYRNVGSHTSGMIQYAYNLYNLNGSQTKLSSLSALLPLNNGDKGDPIDTPVNKSPIVQIENIDTNYEFIRLYSIKYSSLNATPEIKILVDQPVSETITFIDDNNSAIQEITISEFTFLGADVFIPNHLAIKDNRLFIADYKTLPFDVAGYDTRAYSFDGTGTARVEDKDGNVDYIDINNIQELPETHDAINPSIKAQAGDTHYNTYIYGNTGSGIGGTGINISYSVEYKKQYLDTESASMSTNPNYASDQTPFELLSLKSGEVYRIAIQFQNNKGTWSFPKWIADVKIPEIGFNINPTEEGAFNYAYIKVNLINNPSDESITGWRIVYVDRTEADKTVVTQGFLNPTIKDNKSPNFTLYPSYLTRNFKVYSAGDGIMDYRNGEIFPGTTQDPRNYYKPLRYNYNATNNEASLSTNRDDTDLEAYRREILADLGDYELNKIFNCFYSPEVIKNKNNLGISKGDKIRYLGFVRNNYSRSSRDLYDSDGLLIRSKKDYFADNTWSITETLDNDLLIMTLAFPMPPQTAGGNRDRIAGFKLFGAQNPEERDVNFYYSRRTHSFVRYFGSLIYVNNDLNTRTETINETVPYLAPIEGGRNINFSTESVNYNANIKILTEYSESDKADREYATILYQLYGGSCLLLRIEDIESKFPEIDLSDEGIPFLPIAEIIRDIPNQYGGNTYQARQRNVYIPYSDTYPITTSSIDGYMGDTYIQRFNFLKTFKADYDKVTLAEIVSVPLETSVNLDLRYDLLKDRPDNKDADELTSYGFNDVYQQKNNTIKAISKPSNFQEITDFSMDVMPSKLKISGELIDSFTDFLINDRLTLDGKYGAITALFEHNDEVYSFQKNAVAYLSINPRVQINPSDSIAIELGTGRILERYKYLTTTSGSIHKESIIKTNNGIMYFDMLNKSLNFLNNQNADPLSTLNGMYNVISNYVDANKDSLTNFNVLDRKGVISYFDNIKKDIYITFLNDTNNLTLTYNTLSQGFISKVDFYPSMYINFDNTLITSNDRLTLWEHGIGNYNTYYGLYYPSHITLVFNENPDISKITNNLHYNSLFTLDGLDQPNITFNKLQVWNDFQNTGERIISYDKQMLGKKFRRFNFVIPRNENTRDRIFNPWSYIKLTFDKNELPIDLRDEDFKFILHDILVSYNIF